MQSNIMLKPRVLSQILSSANTAGILHTFLLDKDGALIAYSGSGEDMRVTSAIVSNVWACYEKAGKKSLNDDKVEMIILECMEGKVVITAVSNLLLCLYAKKDAYLGLLRIKARMMSYYLQEPLKSVVANR